MEEITYDPEAELIGVGIHATIAFSKKPQHRQTSWQWDRGDLHPVHHEETFRYILIIDIKIS